MAKYIAKKPTYTAWQWTKSIGARIIFPPILLWDLLKLGVNKLVGESVGRLVLPAQSMSFSHWQRSNYTHLDNESLTHEKHEVITHDGAKLDTLEISHRAQSKVAPKFQKYLINFVGNGMSYEQIVGEMQEDANALKCNVVGFNLRGVSLSTGRAKSKNDLVIDGIAQVQRLLDNGVSPQNITLKAHSLGAGVASLVAKHFHDLGQPINVFSSRSFSSITNFVVGQIRLRGGKTGHQETLGGKILGWIAKLFIKLGLLLANWEINAGDAFQAIPQEYKDYMVVRTRKEKRNGYVVDDRVIPHYASIHAHLKGERRAKKAEIDGLINGTKNVAKHADPLTKGNVVDATADLKTAREQFKQRKMEAYASANGHNEDMAELYNRYNKNANTFFREFVQRAAEDHAVKGLEL